MENAVLMAAGGKVDFKSGWSGFWNAVTSSWPKLATALTVIGLVLLIWSLIRYAWLKRKGQGNTNDLVFTTIVGAIFAGPQVILPLALGIFDLIINLLVGVVKSVFNV